MLIAVFFEPSRGFLEFGSEDRESPNLDANSSSGNFYQKPLIYKWDIPFFILGYRTKFYKTRNLCINFFNRYLWLH